MPCGNQAFIKVLLKNITKNTFELSFESFSKEVSFCPAQLGFCILFWTLDVELLDTLSAKNPSKAFYFLFWIDWKFLHFVVKLFVISTSICVFYNTKNKISFPVSKISLIHLVMPPITFTNDQNALRRVIHCVKEVRIRSYFGWYFPAFGLNTEWYEVSPKCRKKRTRITPNTDTFHAVIWGYIYTLKIKIHISVIKRPTDSTTSTTSGQTNGQKSTTNE